MNKSQQTLPYRFFTRHRLFLAINALAINLLGFNGVHAMEPATTVNSKVEELTFQVLLDDDKIGTHRFRIEQTSDAQKVDIDANFTYTFLGIPLYRYTHTNREIWRDGCLASIRSNTDDNGDLFTVEGNHNPTGFTVNTVIDQQDKAPQNLDDPCVMTFAYWDKNFLKQPQLLNSQNGEWLPVDVNFAGIEDIKLNDKTLSAKKYQVRNSDKEIDISVWYDSVTDRWLALESRVSGDRLLRYVPISHNANNGGS